MTLFTFYFLFFNDFLHFVDKFNNGFFFFFFSLSSESDCLPNLRKLTHLNLAWNNFDNKILRCLGALPVLKSLDLSNNYIWPLSSKGTCISEFSSQEYYEKVYTKSNNQYLPLSTFTLFVLKGTKCFSAITNPFDIYK